MGAGQARKTNQVIRGWDFEPSDISQTYREEEEIETEFNHIANESSPSHTYIMKTNKNYGTEACESFLVVDTHQCTRRMAYPKSTEASHWDPPDFPRVSLHLAACDLHPQQ